MAFSIIDDSQFNEANQTLNSFVKNIGKAGEIATTVHKSPLTEEDVERLTS